MKMTLRRLLTATAFISLCSAGAIAQNVPTFMEQSRSFAALNDQNLSERSYSVPAPGPDATQIHMEMKGYIFGLRIVRSDYIAQFDETNYAAYADVKSSGIAALLKSLEIWAVSKGRYNQTGLYPEWHVQQNTDKKNRRVEMNYDRAAEKVDIAIVPPLGSQGIPPATPQERFTANDTISGILAMMMRGTKIDGELCQGRVPFFDSKQHYNLRLERVGTKRVKFDGDKDETIHCRAYYESVSGYDPEDLPSEEEAATPVNVYFKYYPEAGIHVPVRFTYKISAFKAVVKVDEIEIIQAAKS